MKIYAPCPVHGGDNPHGMGIFLNSTPVITWKCFTRHCETKGRNIFNLASMAMNLTYSEVIELCGELYEGEDVIGKPVYGHTNKSCIIPKCYVPSPYFVSRGFRPSTLRKFGVGFCYDKKSPFYGRHITPLIYRGKCYGITGRTIWEQCPKCLGYHNPQIECPGYFIPKWKFSKGVSTEGLFYNYGLALPEIMKTKTAILVEGPPDVWRAYEAGYFNVLGLMGGFLSDFRISCLKTAGVETIILVMDNDSAGFSHREYAIERVKNEFDVLVKVPNSKDLGESTIKEIRELLKHERIKFV